MTTKKYVLTFIAFTLLLVLSLTSFFLLLPGCDINLMHSETLQKYF